MLSLSIRNSLASNLELVEHRLLHIIVVLHDLGRFAADLDMVLMLLLEYHVDLVVDILVERALLLV